MAKEFSQFMKEASEVNEDYKEQCLEYKRAAIDEAERIKQCFEEMLAEGYYYYGAKEVSRRLEDIADELENYKDRMDDSAEVNSGY